MLSETLQKKLDSRGRRQVAAGAVTGKVDLMVRTEDEVTPQQQQELMRIGCKIDFVTGNVFTATIQVDRLDDLAKLPYVRRIELSRLMFVE